MSRARGAVAAAALLALALTGCGEDTAVDRDAAPEPSTSASAPESGSTDPLLLIGSWKLTGTEEPRGTVLRIDGGEVSVWRACGYVAGGMRLAPGLFIGDIDNGHARCDLETPAWLAATERFEQGEEGPVLLDRRGNVTARLQPGGKATAPPGVSDDLAVPPEVNSALRRWFRTPPALPSGVTPATADQLVGRWLPPTPREAQRPEQPHVHLRADGSYRGSDGCNGTGGRWVVGEEGLLLVTGGVSTQIGCANIDVSAKLYNTVRAGLDDGGRLVLFDRRGCEIGRLHRA